MFKKVNKERGSITIEATISLSAFMFTIFTVLTVVNICLIQAKMAFALNNTAKEISQYSYLYALTGLVETQKDAYESGKESTEDITAIINDVSDVYDGIQSLSETATSIGSGADVSDISNAWDKIKGELGDVKDAGLSIKSSVEDIASDPKSVIFGLAKLAGNKALDYGKSKLIAEPLTKVLIKKHLVNSKDGDINATLKRLYIQPSSTGSYFDGISFEGSQIFPNGSPDIRVCATYDVKVIPLLPIDFKFTFSQCALTRGWMGGDVDFKSSKEYVDNNTLWTQATVSERASMIKHLAIEDLEKEGYHKVSGLTNVHMYNKDKNEFVMISSTNPLWSESTQDTLTLDDINEKVVQDSIEQLCGKMNLNTSNVSEVTVKVENKKDGTTTKKTYDCDGASRKIILVIPEDQGLKDKMQTIINNMDTKGVKVELQASFGTGANKTVKEQGGTTK